MAPCPSDEGEDREIFLAAVGDARPLADRDRAPPPRPTVGRPLAAAPDTGAPGFAVEWEGDRVEARAPGVNRRTLEEFRAGRSAPEATLDLHRRTTADSRLLLDRFLAEGTAAGLRLLLVITGKGRHSAGQPVLREAVVEWLAGPLASRVLAFATAANRHGGSGALYILLRRS